MTQHTTTLLEAPAVEVTLFEDRASVLRRGRAALDAGLHTLRLEGVAPVLSDRSLRAELVRDSSVGAKVQDFRVKRELLVGEAELPSDHAELIAEERRRSRALEATRKRIERRVRQRDALRSATAQRIEELAEDAGWGRAEPDRWRADLAKLREREATLDGEILTLHDGLEDAERELAQLQLRLRVLRDHRVATWIELDLELAQPGSVDLEIAYIVPCACWRPRYLATLGASAPDQLELEHQANVWQRTGEDWTEVQLHFSTQRPSLGTEPPLLTDDLLRIQPRQEQVVVELREQQIHTTGLGQQRSENHDLPGVDDGGEPVNLRAAHPATVPSDGRPYRVTIGHSQAPATMERVVMAELASAVLLRCTSANQSSTPLLAGPVDLVAGSGRVGRSHLGFVAPGESFELGFGPDPELRVFRRTERVEQDQAMLSRWQQTDHRVELLLSNLGRHERVVRVLERVPVSELEQVRVELDPQGTSGQATPDADGILTWERRLEPGATASVKLAYSVKKRSGVVER
jgi:uncharacterized protein (TIGR02231 family)